MGTGNDQMLELFLFEMSSLLDQLDEILLNSEKSRELTGDDVNEIFRIMHTIKGSSAMMDFELISTVTHKLEDTFYFIRENGIDQGHFTALFDLMLEASDFLKSQLEAIQGGGDPAAGNDELLRRTVDFLAELQNAGAVPPASPVKNEPAKAAASKKKTEESPAPPAGKAPVPPQEEDASGSWHIEVLFEEDCGMENLRAFMLVNTLRDCCRVLRFEPEDIESNPDSASYILINGFSVDVQTELEESALRAVVESAMHVKSAHMVPLRDHAASRAAAEAAASAVAAGPRYEAVVHFEEDCGMENLRAFMLVNSLRDSCHVVEFDPPDIENNPSTAKIIAAGGFRLILESALSEGELHKLLSGGLYVRAVRLSLQQPPAQKPAQEPEPAALPEARKEPTPDKKEAPAGQASGPEQAAPPSKASSKPASKPAAKHAPIKQDLINVSLSKLDQLMDLMGELVITESMVTRSPDLRDLPHLDNFNKSARQLRKLTDELQDMVMSIRMVPVAGTFQKMQRIVRDMCRNLGKEAELVTMGEETDIDKTIIDGIADPIMHLVRNAMDHGVETPEERMAAGKPPKATITLSAQNTGGEILITVSDDGRGLDAEAILEKARAGGILQKPAAEYSDKEAFLLLCAPGFSTKEAVTEYSGRGVGMDVVKKNIEKVGGSVVIESKKGYGMSVFLKIPLTLAIVDGMDISVGDGIYTLQITAINESFKAANEDVIVDTDGNEMIMIRGSVYPIVRLHQLYNVQDAVTEIEDGILIWVQSDDRSVCLFVDQLIGEQQIVVKPLPVYLNRYNVKPWGISGCTILGDGNISLILDVGSLIEKVMEKR